jgi:hypothetical protein
MLYELSENFKTLFDEFEAIYSWEPEEDENGNFIDDDGNIIEDVVQYKDDMLQAWFDTLEGLEGEFDITAEALALYIKELKVRASAIEIEKAKLELRQKAYKSRSERLTKYLLENMQRMNRKKVETARVVVTTRNNAESVTITEESLFTEWAIKHNDSLLNYPKPKISKTAVKNAIKDGQAVPYAQLVRTQSVTIK